MLLKVNAAALQHQRERAKMTPYKLAKESGLPVNSIYRLENGTTKLTNHLRAREIAKVLDCKVEDIFQIREVRKLKLPHGAVRRG